MTEMKAPRRSALIACADEWLCRSLESVFTDRGYDVKRTGSGRQALNSARRDEYDVLLLDERLPELSGADVCIALRDDPLFDHATPIVVISAAHSTLPGRTAAYAAGAWEYCHLPLDVDGLFLKLSTFRRAREQLAACKAKSMLDAASGLYTPFGTNWPNSWRARAVRNHEPFACPRFLPATSRRREMARDSATMKASPTLLISCRAGRKSDVVAKTGDSQLSIPPTPCRRRWLLVARLQRRSAASRKSRLGGAITCGAGYCAVPDLTAANVDPERGTVHRAESALASLPLSGGEIRWSASTRLPVS
jgi:CheY-like chemotaxis protein